MISKISISELEIKHNAGQDDEGNIYLGVFVSFKDTVTELALRVNLEKLAELRDSANPLKVDGSESETRKVLDNPSLPQFLFIVHHKHAVTGATLLGGGCEYFDGPCHATVTEPSVVDRLALLASFMTSPITYCELAEKMLAAFFTHKVFKPAKQAEEHDSAEVTEEQAATVDLLKHWTPPAKGAH
jgi:hypothetical protein